jgi:hypothetical protein
MTASFVWSGICSQKKQKKGFCGFDIGIDCDIDAVNLRGVHGRVSWLKEATLNDEEVSDYSSRSPMKRSDASRTSI